MNQTTSTAQEPRPADPQVEPPPSGWLPPEKSWTTIAVILAIALAAVLALLYAWRLPPFAGLTEQTDNAYVRGRVAVISPQVNGYVWTVPVKDFAKVRKGQILATIDDRIYRARVAQAEANVAAQEAALANSTQAQRSREVATLSQDAGIANARAQLVRAEADMRRADRWWRTAPSPRASGIGRAPPCWRRGRRRVEPRPAGRSARRMCAPSSSGAAGLRRQWSRARQLRLARIDLDNTIIRAPVDGQLSEVGVRTGAYVTAGTQLMFLVPHDVWVVANFKEAQTRDMRIGQRATFRVDALGNARLEGRVENLSPAAGSEFSVIRPDNATGNFVKVAQRIAVRIGITPGQALAARLRPGMSVVAKVHTSRGAAR